jgi:hypothetical protein
MSLENRYSEMKYNRCGRSGLMLPALSLGLWHNLGGEIATYSRHQMEYSMLFEYEAAGRAEKAGRKGGSDSRIDR